jgi:cytidylate kinase
MISVAIDGPAGAGKSTIARKLAAKIGAIYIDSGSMYRALTYKALCNQVSLDDEDALVSLLKNSQIVLEQNLEGQQIFLDGKNVTEEIRSPVISQHVSAVARHPKVREIMVQLQREYAKENSVVMDGRDIGTVVLPHADVKIFLTASVEERAERRYKELLHKGYQPIISEILSDIKERDRLDIERETSPLKKAEDAIEIDATHLTIDQVVEKVYQLCSKDNH